MKKILTFSLLVVLSYVASAQAQKIVADKIIGVVGDRIILQSDVKNAIADASRSGQPLPEDAECLILEQALVSKVLMLQAVKDSLPVTDEEVEADLDLRIREFIRSYGTQEELERVAGKTIYQIKDDARESIKESKLAQAMQRKIVDNVRITPNEVKAYFDKVPKDSLPFFESELEIGQIIVYPKASRDLEQYIIDELNTYKKQLEAKLTPFEQLAKRVSEGEDEKIRGREFEINRTAGQFDPAFLTAAFRLKDGQISAPFKSKFGYHIVQMVQRNGDNAIVRHILRKPPVTDAEINAGMATLDSVRSKLIAGTIDFNTAAGRYSEDEAAKFAGAFITSRDGDTYLTIDELDKDIVTALEKLSVGAYSQPAVFTNERGDKGVRILYLKSRSEPHRMNVRDDYNKISQAALEEKKAMTSDKWLNSRIASYYIMIDPSVATCPQLQKWTGAAKVAGIN
ncbi:MAG TPA: peptidylprolyl isomerase [Flavisolibacter sp.]|nr:peptidylprolyl isomerase [Flavisolibacter sp.]